MFKVLKLHHVALAPRDPEKAAAFFSLLDGIKTTGTETVASQQVKTTFLQSEHEVDPTQIELLEIAENTESNSPSPIRSFLEKKGGGIHHLSFEVDDIEAAYTFFEEKGLHILSKKPQPGSHNSKIFFLHPESTGGLLVEFSEHQ